MKKFESFLSSHFISYLYVCLASQPKRKKIKEKDTWPDNTQNANMSSMHGVLGCSAPWTGAKQRCSGGC